MLIIQNFAEDLEYGQLSLSSSLSSGDPKWYVSANDFVLNKDNKYDGCKCLKTFNPSTVELPDDYMGMRVNLNMSQWWWGNTTTEISQLPSNVKDSIYFSNGVDILMNPFLRYRFVKVINLFSLERMASERT